VARPEFPSQQNVRGRVVFLLWVAMTFLSLTLGALLLEVPKYYRLDEHGIKLSGRIIELQLLNHASVRYEYEVDSRPYTGIGHAGDIGSTFDDLRPGESVSVFYDPQRPEFSCLGEPRQHLNSLLRGTGLISTFPTLFFLAVKIRGVLRRSQQ